MMGKRIMDDMRLSKEPVARTGSPSTAKAMISIRRRAGTAASSWPACAEVISLPHALGLPLT
jgi:hypothetical protein